MQRSRGVALLSVALFAFYGCGGDDDTGEQGTGATSGRAGAGGRAGSAGAAAKGGSANPAGSAGKGTAGSGTESGGRGGTSSGAGNGGRGGAAAGAGGGLDGGRGGTSGVGGSAGEAGGGQAGGGQAGDGQAGTSAGGTNGGAGATGAGNGGEGGQKCTPGENLVDNGDFEAGNVSLTTEYELVTAPDQITDAGQCIIAPDASVVRDGATDWAAFGDHTSGSGNMFICDGNVTADRYAWSQTVTVVPHEWYVLHFWFASVEANATLLPSLQPFADAVEIGGSLPADATGAWTEYTGFYRAGDNTTATLTIVDTSTEGAQNDFALDDVSFALTCGG